MNVHGPRLKALFKRLPGTNALAPLIASRRAMEQFKQEFEKFGKLIDAAPEKRFDLRWEDRYPCLNDRKSTTNFETTFIIQPGRRESWQKLAQPSMWTSNLHFISVAFFRHLFRFAFTTISRKTYG